MNNQIRLSGDKFLIRDFTIEVDNSVATDVKKAVEGTGFKLRGAPLAERQEIRDAVQQLVTDHRNELQLRYAIWFRLGDPETIHLLEIADDVFDDETSSDLAGVALIPGKDFLNVRAIVIYLASPGEFRRAMNANNEHAVLAVQQKDAAMIWPEGDSGWGRLFSEFGIQNR